MAIKKTEYLKQVGGSLGGMRESIISGDLAAPIAERFKAFSDPSRIKILIALENGELCVNNISGLVDLPQPTVSHHLKALRQLGIIRYRRSGRMTLYSIKDNRVLGLLAIARDFARDNV